MEFCASLAIRGSLDGPVARHILVEKNPCQNKYKDDPSYRIGCTMVSPHHTVDPISLARSLGYEIATDLDLSSATGVAFRWVGHLAATIGLRASAVVIRSRTSVNEKQCGVEVIAANNYPVGVGG